MVNQEQLIQYNSPSLPYLEACSKTLSTGLYLENGSAHYESDVNMIKLEVIRQIDMQRDFIHEFYASVDFLKVPS